MDRGKYRGLRLDNGEWETGCLFRNTYNKRCYIVSAEFSAQELAYTPKLYDAKIAWHHVHSDTVGQYTGLKDKNGVDLDWWESDVFSHPSGGGIIKWKSGGLYMHDESGFTPIGEAVHWKVLPKKTGTIHDKKQ